MHRPFLLNILSHLKGVCIRSRHRHDWHPSTAPLEGTPANSMPLPSQPPTPSSSVLYHPFGMDTAKNNSIAQLWQRHVCFSRGKELHSPFPDDNSADVLTAFAKESTPMTRPGLLLVTSNRVPRDTGTTSEPREAAGQCCKSHVAGRFPDLSNDC